MVIWYLPSVRPEILEGESSERIRRESNVCGCSSFYEPIKTKELNHAIFLHRHQSAPRDRIKPGTPLTFAGTDAPAAFARLKSIGLPRDRCPELSEEICGFIYQELGVPVDRIFIDFKDLDGSMFGWNGKTF